MDGRVILGSAAAVLIIGGLAWAQQPPRPSGAVDLGKSVDEHVVMKSSELKWQDGPPTLPKGVKVAILEGDPATPGRLFTMRAKLPARTRIMPHFHGTDERVTVISGEAKVGMGERFDEKATQTLSSGGFFIMPAGHRHFLVASRETEIQLNGVGPWSITYVNPEDDPSRGVGGAGPDKGK